MGPLMVATLANSSGLLMGGDVGRLVDPLVSGLTLAD
jgi:hypothetical protein